MNEQEHLIRFDIRGFPPHLSPALYNLGMSYPIASQCMSIYCVVHMALFEINFLSSNGWPSQRRVSPFASEDIKLKEPINIIVVEFHF